MFKERKSTPWWAIRAKGCLGRSRDSTFKKRPQLSMQERGHLLEQCLLFEIGEFTRVKIHTMLGTRLVTNMRLIGVFDVFHGLVAPWAGAIGNIIIGFTSFGVARVEEFRHPLVFELFGFAQIEPDPLAAGASVNCHITAVSGFFHRNVTFWAIHLRVLYIVFEALRCASRTRGMQYTQATGFV